jgi:FAD/FMN-containing dehydrogenase
MDAEKRVEKIFSEAGWEVDQYAGIDLHDNDNRKFMREFARMLNNFPWQHLTCQTLEIMEYALRWMENTSHKFASPISGRADGIAPDGVLYPYITMELHESSDVQREWIMRKSALEVSSK